MVFSLYPGWGAGGAYHLSPTGLHFCYQSNAPKGHTASLLLWSQLSDLLTPWGFPFFPTRPAMHSKG